MQAGPGRDVPAAEVDAAGAYVGGAGVEQGAGQPHDGVDVAVCPGLVVGAPHVQRRHVALEQELPDGGEVVRRGPGAVGGGVEHVVDVGDVAAHDRLHAEDPAQHPGQRVYP